MKHKSKITKVGTFNEETQTFEGWDFDGGSAGMVIDSETNVTKFIGGYTPEELKAIAREAK